MSSSDSLFDFTSTGFGLVPTPKSILQKIGSMPPRQPPKRDAQVTMDDNILRQMQYFSVPNNQTQNRNDQSGDPTGSASGQGSSLWDPLALNVDGTLSDPASAAAAQNYAPLANFGQPTGPQTQAFNASGLSPSLYGQPSRPILPTRAPRSRDGRERKRSKLSTESTPFDSVDYWLQFDTNQEPVMEESSAEPSVSNPSISNPHKRNRTAVSQQASNPQTTASSSKAPKPEQTPDDSALEKALSEEDDMFSLSLAEQMSKIESMPPADIPTREGLYSTPLSWEKPQMGMRFDPLMGLQPPSLNEAEQRRLIAIAMNSGSSMGGLGSDIPFSFGAAFPSNFGSAFGGLGMDQFTDTAPHPKPEPRDSAHDESPVSPSYLQAQASRASASEKGKEKVMPGDRTAHNDIERKYRTNLKDKISELRDAVPSLRTIPENSVDDGDSSNNPSRAPKVSKGTVLTKATEYIHYLEKKNRAIQQQHHELSRRLQAFEQLLNASARQTYQMPMYSRTLFDPRAFC